MYIKEIIENIIRKTFIYYILKPIYDKQAVLKWEKKGKPIPLPDPLKRVVIKEYANKFSLFIFVETGTYFGDTIAATKDIFSKIFSIEIDKALYYKAKKRFAKFGYIDVIHGDSGTMLPKILSHISQPCLFWLDAHYSRGVTGKGARETPIIQELTYILNHPTQNHVILIDDARDYVGKGDYPTIQELKNFVLSKHPDWVFEIKDDIIRVHRQQ